MADVTPQENEDTMTAKDAAALLGVSPPTIKRMVIDGRITPVEPYRGFSKRQNLRFTRAEVLRVKNLPPPAPPTRKPRKKRNAPPDVITEYAVTVHTPPTVAAVERLLVDRPAPYTAD